MCHVLMSLSFTFFFFFNDYATTRVLPCPVPLSPPRRFSDLGRHPVFRLPHPAHGAARRRQVYVVFTKGAGPGAGGPGRLYKFDGSNWTLLKSVDPSGGTNFGLGGVSVHGSGATTRIALGVTNSWGNWNGQQIVQLSDDAGQTWREIEAMMPGEKASGWVDDVEIDPSNRDHILHVHGGGVVETKNASSATPSWNGSIEGIEEIAVLAIATPPPGAPYTLINSSGDVGIWVHTDLKKAPTMAPNTAWNNGNSADMAWSDPLYIAGIGTNNTTNPHLGTGYWSGDGGKTWATFATLPTGGAANTGNESNIVVTARNKAIWAPANSVPSYTVDNGANWLPTNLPALSSIGIGRSYRMAVDRKNPNKVYAYDSGGHWWGTQGKVYVSTDGGRNFTLSQGSVTAKLTPSYFGSSSIAVNPNVEGDVWLADGNAVYHSVDSGATWTKVGNFASIITTNQWADVQGASAIALGKAAPGAKYSAAIYVVGVVDRVWGVYRSDDGGATWTRFNDDAHQYGGIGVLAADQNIYGRIYFSGTGRGMLYTN
jgi:hypothetical protein